jgi:hypothetical protein
MLTRQKAGHQHPLSVRELQGVMVHADLVHVDLAKSRNFVTPRFSRPQTG